MSLCEFHILAPVLFMIQYNMQTICDLSFSGTQFSTKDNDNDRRKFSCSQTYKGAWWYNACHSSNLMACILMVHIPLLPMALTGTRSEVTIIL